MDELEISVPVEVDLTVFIAFYGDFFDIVWENTVESDSLIGIICERLAMTFDWFGLQAFSRNYGQLPAGPPGVYIFYVVGLLNCLR